MGQLYLYMGGIRLNSNIKCVFQLVVWMVGLIILVGFRDVADGGG